MLYDTLPKLLNEVLRYVNEYETQHRLHPTLAIISRRYNKLFTQHDVTAQAALNDCPLFKLTLALKGGYLVESNLDYVATRIKQALREAGKPLASDEITGTYLKGSGILYAHFLDVLEQLTRNREVLLTDGKFSIND